MGSEGNVPVGVVFKDEGGGSVGVDDSLKNVEVGNPCTCLAFVGCVFFAFGYAVR